MKDLLVLKETIIKFYQKTEIYWRPLWKFILSILVFTMINRQLDYDPKLMKTTIVIGLSVLSAFTPPSVLVFLSAIVVIGHIYYISPVLSIIVIAVFFILYLLFARYAPKQGYIIVAIPILSLFNMTYFIPILLGMIATPIAIIPTGCGIIVYYLIRLIKETAETTISSSPEDILALYKYVIDGFITNKEMQLMIVVFAIVIIVTYLVKRLKIDYAFYIAIVAGALTNVLAFLIGDLIVGISNQIGILILNTVLSALIMLVIQFFRLSLDYTAVEHTQFEDEDYYYYVKAVPKMKITVGKKDVKRINVQKSTGNTMNLKSTIDQVAMEHDTDLKEEKHGNLSSENMLQRDAYLRDTLDSFEDLDDDDDYDSYDDFK